MSGCQTENPCLAWLCLAQLCNVYEKNDRKQKSENFVFSSVETQLRFLEMERVNIFRALSQLAMQKL